MKLTNPESRHRLFYCLHVFAFLVCYVGVAWMTLSRLYDASNTSPDATNKEINFAFLLWAMIAFFGVWLGTALERTGDSPTSYVFFYYFFCNWKAGVGSGIAVLTFFYGVAITLNVASATATAVNQSALPSTVSGFYHKYCPVFKVATEEENKL